MSLEQQANFGNGLLVLSSSLLGCCESTRIYGTVLGIFMGLGLTFSGVANYCGWYCILAKMPWNRRRLATVNSAIKRSEV